MLEYLIQLDSKLFLFLNGLHTHWLDPIMWFFSLTKVWIPIYILLVIFIIRKYTKQSIWVILSFALTIILSDQLSSGVVKPLVKRPRPSHEILLEGKVHILKNYKGGKFGFVSSHAANTFALALYITFLFRNKRFSIVFFIWATIVSYSRIYLGVHYPADIIGGALIGCLSAWLVFHATKYVFSHYYKTKSLL